MKMIERDGKVLDLGCGTGTASLELSKNGFTPFPVDASLEMVKVAETLLEIKPKQISFDEIDEHDFYDAIWANFSLLHIKKNQFSGILKRSRRPNIALALIETIGSGNNTAQSFHI